MAVLRDPSRGSAVSYERKYIGSYRYICGKCGAKMHHTVATHAGGNSYSTYRCTAATHLSRAQGELDAYVEHVALEYLRRGERLAEKLAEDGNPIDLNEMRARRIALQARADDLAAAFADGEIDRSQLKRGSADLRAKIAEIDTTLAGLTRTSPLAAMAADGPDEIEQRWAEASPDMRGKVIDELFTVVVHPAPKGRYFKREYIEFGDPRRD